LLSAAGQFNIPHNIAMHPDNDKIIVVDRENSRAQLFKLDGTFVELWPIHRAVAVVVGKIHDGTDEKKVLIAEQGTSSRVQKGDGLNVADLPSWTHNIGHRIGVYKPDGERIAAIGASTPVSLSLSLFPVRFVWCGPYLLFGVARTYWKVVLWLDDAYVGSYFKVDRCRITKNLSEGEHNSLTIRSFSMPALYCNRVRNLNSSIGCIAWR
jgi:hypothetical protein